MTRRRVAPFVVLFAAVAAGCAGGDEIRTYEVPRGAAPTRKAAVEYRLLGVMVPADVPVWFFKLSGTAESLAPHEAGFDQLLASIRFKDEKSVPEFAAPAGWKLGGPRSVSKMGVTVTLDQTVTLPDPGLELTVSKSGGGVAQNLGRWVGMLGQKAGLDDAAKYTKAVDAAGGKVLRVDIRGDQNPSGGGGPMMGKMR